MSFFVRHTKSSYKQGGPSNSREDVEGRVCLMRFATRQTLFFIKGVKPRQLST